MHNLNQATLLHWQGKRVGVRVNRRYGISHGRFRDFFGDKRPAKYGVWRLSSGEIYAGGTVNLNKLDDYVQQVVNNARESGNLLRQL